MKTMMMLTRTAATATTSSRRIVASTAAALRPNSTTTRTYAGLSSRAHGVFATTQSNLPWQQHQTTANYPSRATFKMCSFSSSSSGSSNNNTSASNSSSSATDSITSVYVHPLSQLVLNTLQSHCHEWVVRHGLDQSLNIHRDGTFVLEQKQQQRKLSTMHDRKKNKKETDDDEPPKMTYVSSSYSSTEKITVPTASTEIRDDVLRIWTSYDPMDKKHWLSVRLPVATPSSSSASNGHQTPSHSMSSSTTFHRGISGSTRSGIITQTTTATTSGNEQTKQQSPPPVVLKRFLLQDNLLPAWQGGGATRHKSLPERIQDVVQEMITVVDSNPILRQRVRSSSS